VRDGGAGDGEGTLLWVTLMMAVVAVFGGGVAETGGDARRGC